jgi:hypothetical protein
VTRDSNPAPSRGVPLHPFLFAAVIVTTLWLDSAVSPYAVVRSLVGALLVAGALTALAALALRSVQLGGLAATALIWMLWSKHLVELAATAFERLGGLAILWLAAIVILVVLVARRLPRNAHRWTRETITSFLNRAGALLLITTLLLGFFSGAAQSAVRDLAQGVELGQWAGGDVSTGEMPDIYAILLDGYPRADVLEYAFDIDNSPFTQALAERGFDIASLAHSDYLWTHVSVPSALNLAYVEQIAGLADVAAGRVAQQPTIRHAIAENAAFEIARNSGYDTIAIASGFEQVAARQADVWVDGGQLTEFEVSLLASTFAGELLGVVAPDLASSQHRQRILGNLDVLAEIAAARDRPPALVFAHIPAPHQPTVFGRDGAPVAVPISDHFYADSPMERSEDPAEFSERYRVQLPYLNERILAAIDGILEQSAQPPIIVLFADHGSASRTDWNETDPANVDPTILLERTGILFAALTPGREDVYPDDVSPVDLFRLIFDAYLGTEYGRAVPPDGGGQIAPVDASVFDAGQ